MRGVPFLCVFLSFGSIQSDTIVGGDRFKLASSMDSIDTFRFEIRTMKLVEGKKIIMKWVAGIRQMNE